MKLLMWLSILFLFACAEKKPAEKAEVDNEVKTEIALSDSTANKIDKDLEEIDNLLKEIE